MGSPDNVIPEIAYGAGEINGIVHSKLGIWPIWQHPTKVHYTPVLSHYRCRPAQHFHVDLLQTLLSTILTCSYSGNFLADVK